MSQDEESVTVENVLKEIVRRMERLDHHLDEYLDRVRRAVSD